MPTLHHVAVAVRDVEAAARAYSDLGLPIGEAKEWETENTREIYVNTAPVRMLLMQPRSATGPIAKHVARRGPGFHHLGFVATDVRSILKTLTAWYICPSTFRNLEGQGPAWIIRPDAGLLVELQGVDEIRKLAGPDVFRHVTIDLPDVDVGRRLFKAMGVADDPHLQFRGGVRGVHHVELQVDGRRVQFAAAGLPGFPDE